MWSALLLLTPLSAAAPGDVLDAYLNAALRGDLRGAAAIFEAAGNDLTARERQLRDDYRRRFVDREETWASVGSELVDDLLDLYREYWRRGLMGELDDETKEAWLRPEVGEVLRANGVPTPEGEDVLERMVAALGERGYHAIGGVTRPFYELMIWRRQDERSFTVELTDATIQVEVAFLGDFVSRGWTHFATFGISSTGGWATREKLFCLEDDYDLDSERFRISYLKHEGRHFADYRRFPMLEQADLEYRGKLTELAFAGETQADLLETFEVNAAPDPRAPHSLANHAVVHALRERLLRGDAPAGAQAWRGIDADAVRRVARALLETHTAELELAGAADTRGVLDARPEGR